MTISLFTLTLIAALIAIAFMYVKIKRQRNKLKVDDTLLEDYRRFSIDAAHRRYFIIENQGSIEVISYGCGGLVFIVKTFEYKEGDLADYEYALLEAEELKSHLEYKI